MQHKKLNLFEKGQVVALVANGESYRSVSRKMGVNDKNYFQGMEELQRKPKN